MLRFISSHRLTGWRCMLVDNRCWGQDLLVNNWLVVDDRSVVDHWCNDLGSVNSRAGLGDDGVESVDVISGVVDGANAAIGLDQRVLSLHHSTVTNFTLVLNVSGVVILHAIVERVARVILDGDTKRQFSVTFSPFRRNLT